MGVSTKHFDEFKPDFDIKVRGQRSCGCDNMKTKKGIVGF